MISPPPHFGWLLVLCLYKDDYLQMFGVCSFDSTAVAQSGKVEPINRLPHQLDGYSYFNWLFKSMHNHCETEHFGDVFVLSHCFFVTLLFKFSLDKGAFVVVVVCGLTSHSAIFQLYSDGRDVQFPNFDLLPGTHAMGSCSDCKANLKVQT